ncbi:MAG: FG-GAP-like repeat-containing protein, partial [Planctomycetota bacterium]
MRKLGILFLILGLTLVNRWLLALVPPLAPMVREPETYAMVLALQAALLFAGGVMVFLPLVWRRGPAGLPAAGILLAIPVALFVHQWALERRMPDMVQRLKSRWDGSYLHHYSDAYLERVSVWAMGLDERREGVKAVKMHLPIGEYLLRLGRVPEALEHFKRAYGIASNHPKGTELLPDAARALGMAYLRAGEIESCLDQPNPESCVFPLQGGGVWTRTEDAERAAKLFEQVLELSPGDPGARWLLAVANQAAGREPEVRLEGVSLPEWMVRGEVDAPRFTNLAGPLGVGEDDLAGSVLMEDFDGDGFVDIITCSYDPRDPLTYHHNEGDGTFSDWTARAGLSEQKGGLNLTLADYDNDGRTDILVLRGAWFLSDGYQRN